MTTGFMHKTVALKFFVGEVLLCSARFSAFISDTYFTKLPKDVVDPPQLKTLFINTDVVYFPSHPLATPVPRLSISSSSIRYVPHQYDHYYITIKGAFADYLKKFSAKTRSTLRRKVRKLAGFSGGNIEWREFVMMEEMTMFHDLARQVAVKTYQERLLGVALLGNK